MRIFLILLLINTISTHAYSMGYKVVNRNEIAIIEAKKSTAIDTTFILEKNGVFVTIFKDGSSLMAPPVLGGAEGIFFENIDEMNAMIKSGIYPVKGTGTFWEREKERVLNFQESQLFYLQKVSEAINYKVEFNNDPIYLKEISRRVSERLKLKKNNKDLYNYFAVYIGELIRRKNNGGWKLHTEKAFNVYYQPEIVIDNKYCNPWSNIISELEMASYNPISIEEIILRSSIFNPYTNRDYKLLEH